MPEDVRSLAEQHQAFYEISPYYVIVDDTAERSASSGRRIQAGFDIDIYGVSTSNRVEAPEPDEYETGYIELQKMAEDVLRRIGGDSWTLDVIPFPSTAFFDVQHQGKLEAMIRLRISHCGDLGQPAGAPEQNALDEIEKLLKTLGIGRR